ncbi:MAG: hypothetical protein IAF02_22735, partial [Anaerolineae bacterium]|nr:hypothetical protein [Anaerolineae bacterium]
MDSNTFPLKTSFFRPNFRISGVIISIFLVILAIGGIFLLSQSLPTVCLALIGLLLAASAIVGIFTIWHQYKAYIQINESSISGHNGRKAFNYTWLELIVAQIREPENEYDHPWLVLITQDAQTGINIDSFDKTAVWQAIETYAPPEILEPDAYKKLDSYKTHLSTISSPLQVSVPFRYRIFYALMFLFMAFIFVIALTNNVPIAATFCFTMASLSLYWITQSFGTVEADSKAITIKKFWGNYQLQWSEIRFLKVNGYTGSYVFHGENKHLCMPAPNLWGGSQKDDFYLF